jgi:hypothetical protein
MGLLDVPPIALAAAWNDATVASACKPARAMPAPALSHAASKLETLFLDVDAKFSTCFFASAIAERSCAWFASMRTKSRPMSTVPLICRLRFCALRLADSF